MLFGVGLSLRLLVAFDNWPSFNADLDDAETMLNLDEAVTRILVDMGIGGISDGSQVLVSAGTRQIRLDRRILVVRIEDLAGKLQMRLAEYMELRDRVGAAVRADLPGWTSEMVLTSVEVDVTRVGRLSRAS